MLRNYLFSVLFTVICHGIHGQLPGTNVYSFDIDNANGVVTIGSGIYVSGFNKGGYNNQPSFINGEIYLTSNWKEEGQTDILALDLNSRSLNRVTATPESEYSPTLMPDKDYFSVVRVEQDGKDSQVLWKYPIDRSNHGEKIFDNITNVGYHIWINRSLVGMFLVGEPHTLVVRNVFADHNKILAQNIGRSLHTKGGNLIYIEKSSDEAWYIMSYNSYTEEYNKIIQTLPKREDFLLLHDGTILMGDGSSLFAYNGKIHTSWTKIADLSPYGISNITRLATDHKKLLLVDAGL